MSISLIAVLWISLQILAIRAAPKDALVASLPGFQGPLLSKHYAGYVTVNEEHGRQLYYYFVTSERNPAKDPVVLWLNGGPGCSSFDGFVYEHGPFKFSPAGAVPKLVSNPYSWSKVASMLYVDSPAGVGLSYSNDSSDYNTGDKKTAIDTHTFLLKWFQLYPELLSNPLFVSGESYAGVYVPTLSQEIANGISTGVKPLLNFKGYIVGNGVTDQRFDGDALVPFVHGMGLISDFLYQEVVKACNGAYWNASSVECNDKLDQVVENLGDLNIYDILEPCYHDTSRSWDIIRLPTSMKQLGVSDGGYSVRKRIFGRAWPLRLPFKDGHVPNWHQLTGLRYVPCVDTNLAKIWLNNPAVRKALHALPEEVIGEWEVCTDKLNYDHDTGSMIPFHRNLTSKGYRALIFSGDHDMCVPFTGSEAWTRAMGYPVISEWHEWVVENQVAGYTVTYGKGLTFATVKGAGHTVPEYKPKEALAMFQRWLQDSPL